MSKGMSGNATGKRAGKVLDARWLRRQAERANRAAPRKSAKKDGSRPTTGRDAGERE